MQNRGQQAMKLPVPLPCVKSSTPWERHQVTGEFKVSTPVDWQVSRLSVDGTVSSRQSRDLATVAAGQTQTGSDRLLATLVSPATAGIPRLRAEINPSAIPVNAAPVRQGNFNILPFPLEIDERRKVMFQLQKNNSEGHCRIMCPAFQRAARNRNFLVTPWKRQVQNTLHDTPPGGQFIPQAIGR